MNYELMITSRWFSLLRFFILCASGICLVFAFPYFNYYLIAWIGIIPLYFLTRRVRWYKAWIRGYIWGYAWSVASCFWLREIEPFIPFTFAFILAFFYAFWAIFVPITQRYLFIPLDVLSKGHDNIKKYYTNHNFYIKECLSALFLASWWCVLEWLRTWIFSGFPWNLIAVTQWQEYPIIQIASITGIYGISFIIIYFNIACGDTILRFLSSFKNFGKRGLRPLSLYIAILFITLAFLFGVIQIKNIQINKKTEKTANFRAGVVEGDIPQCRFYNAEQANFALSTYIDLSKKILLFKPDVLIWPESAVPQPLRGRGYMSEKYRYELGELIKEFKIPILLGSTDFGFGEPAKAGILPIYNSALYIDGKGKVIDKYNKIHIVPWGEYTPGENTFPFKYIYPWIKRTFGMGRSLSQGTRNTIFNLDKSVRAGVLICYEDVYPNVAREHVLAGANLLILITNDAWYPTSDEPEQHLAHAIFRAVENGRTMIRVGNCTGTCVIQPTGAITDSLFHKVNKTTGNFMPDPAKRGAGTAIFNTKLLKNPRLTFYTKYGNVFILFCGIICFLFISFYFYKWILYKKHLNDLLK